MILEFYGQILEHFSNIKFNGYPSSGSRVVPWERRDMAKVIGACSDVAKAPENGRLLLVP
jgi:hypothetical protein